MRKIVNPHSFLFNNMIHNMPRARAKKTGHRFAQVLTFHSLEHVLLLPPPFILLASDLYNA